jgi:hypothetical protein
MPEPLATGRSLRNGRAAPHTSPASLADMLRARLELNPVETTIMLRLVTRNQIAREQIGVIAMCNGRRSTSNVSTIIRELRKKLQAHSIKINAIYQFGWELPQDARKKIFALAAFCATNGHAKPQVKPQPKPTRPIRTEPAEATATADSAKPCQPIYEPQKAAARSTAA